MKISSIYETSLVVQQLRIHLPMEGTWVPPLVQEDPTCLRATKPVIHNHWSLGTLEPMLPNMRSHCNEKALISCLVVKLCPTFAAPWTLACQAPLSMGFPRQEEWSGLPFPSLGDLPDTGIQPTSPALSALKADSLPSEPRGKPTVWAANKKLIYRVVSSRF